jgi:hypothetical protein
MNHAIKIENLEMNEQLADQYAEVIKDFLSSLEFSDDRIESLESRRRDSFIPHSYNCGGFEAIAYDSQFHAQFESTGFENTDKVLNKYYDYDLKSWLEENNKPADYKMTQSDYESLDEYRQSDDATVQFQARVMMTSDTTASVDFYVSVINTPYHRSSDDNLELEIKFKTPAGMKRQLIKLLKNDFVRNLKANVRGGY